MAESSETLKRVISIPCSQCGAQMRFDAAHGMMHCDSCGHTSELPQTRDQIVEQDFMTALEHARYSDDLGVASRHFSCRTCGARELVPTDTVSIECSFCGSKNINEEAFDQQIIQPSGVLPFEIERRKAVAVFREWLGKGWFTPSKLQKIARLDTLDGVYLPFWTYDCGTDSQWTAEAGYYYYVTVTYRDENGEEQQRQEQRIRWEPAAGFYRHFFDDLLVVASQGVKQDMMEKIYPFSLDRAVNFTPEYLLGWKAEVYGLDVKQGFGVANDIMDQFIYQECGRLVPGDTFRNLRVETNKYDVTFKHLLLPVWIAAYRYNDRLYQVLINGQTGKISGNKPLSVWKIALAVLILLLVAAIIYFIVHSQQ